MVGVSVTSSADGIARDLVKDEQPTDLGKETQVVWPQPIDATSGQAIVSFTPTFGAPDAMIPEEEFDGERQFGVTITLRLYYPMQGFSDARRRGRRLLGRFVGRETAAKLLPPKLVKRQDDVDGESDVPQLEELVEVDVVAAFNYGTNFDLNTPTDQPDNPGDDDGLPDPNGGPNEWSSRPADFWSSGVMGYLALGFGLIALITTWIKALAGGDNVSDVVVESARPRIFNILPSFMDIVTLSQQIFMLGCLNLGTTDMFNRFAGNFKWSMLVFRVPFLQNLAAQIYSTEQYFTYPTGPYPIVPRRLQTRLYEPGMEHMDKGMQATAFEIGINLGDYFITSFFLFLIVQLVLMVGGAMALFILEIRHEVSHVAKYRTVRTSIVTWTFAAVVRFFNFFYMPLVLFCVFQMSYDNKNDYVPWYLTFWCVVVFVSALLVLPGYICYKIFSTWPKDGLYSNDRKLLVLGTFYNTYKVQKLWFVVADFGYRFLSGCFVGMGFTNGYVQSSLWAIVILTYAVMVGVQKPYSRKERFVPTIVYGRRAV